MPLFGQSLHEVGFCVSIPKAVQADKPLPSGWTNRRVLDLWTALDGIALSPQRFQKHIVAHAPGQRRVNVTADQVTDGRFAASLGVPLGIMLALSFGTYDREAIFPAYGV